MSPSRTWSALALLGCILCSKVARADLTFPRPIFTQDRKFQILAPARVIKVAAQIPFPVFAFEDSLSQCPLNMAQVSTQLERSFTKGSRLEQALSLLDPQFLDALSHLKVTIVLDDFGGRNEIFRSFYLPNQPEKGDGIIALDCSQQTQEQWESILAHEIVHVLSQDRGLESWFEEGLAQLIEVQSGGNKPWRSAASVKKLNLIPNVFETQRPLPSTESYGLAFLFVKYLESNWGGWPLLSALYHSDYSPVEPKEGKFLELLTSFARKFLDQAQYDSHLTAKMTPKGIFQNFVMALMLHRLGHPFYSLPDWPGFSSEPASNLPPYPLEKGQWIRIKPDLNLEKMINSGLEGYRVQANLKDFDIQKWSDPSKFLKETVINEMVFIQSEGFVNYSEPY